MLKIHQSVLPVLLTSESSSLYWMESIVVPVVVFSGIFVAYGSPVNTGLLKFLYTSILTVALIFEVLEGDPISKACMYIYPIHLT